jgi:hypothetical protein
VHKHGDGEECSVCKLTGELRRRFGQCAMDFCEEFSHVLGATAPENPTGLFVLACMGAAADIILDNVAAMESPEAGFAVVEEMLLSELAKDEVSRKAKFYRERVMLHAVPKDVVN